MAGSPTDAPPGTLLSWGIIVGVVAIAIGVALIILRKRPAISSLLTSFFAAGKHPPPIVWEATGIMSIGIVVIAIGIFGLTVVGLGF